MAPAVELDAIDRVIIENLQIDGRMPYAQLAPLAGLSEAATRQRVNKLIERGAMQVVAVTDPAHMGMHYPAMIGINTVDDITTVAKTLGAVEEVVYLMIVTGRYDILAEVACRDSDHLLSVVNDDIRQISGVQTTEVFSYLRLVKQTYGWGAG